MIRITSIVGYDLGKNVAYYAVNNRSYRKHKNEFFNDRRAIPERWIDGMIKAWKAREGQWFSAPFDGVWDFNLIVDGKPR